MQYFEEMNDKYGFSDGGALPDGIEQYRSVYIQGFNKLLKDNGSDVRVIAYNRPGCHNSVMVLRVTAEEFTAIPPKDVTDGDFDVKSAFGKDWKEPEIDDGYDAAKEIADTEAGFDEMVEVKVTVNESSLQAFLDS